jgi:hypothetical protein
MDDRSSYQSRELECGFSCLKSGNLATNKPINFLAGLALVFVMILAPDLALTPTVPHFCHHLLQLYPDRLRQRPSEELVLS